MAGRGRTRERSEAADAHVPRLPRAYVDRARLWSRLDAATAGAVTVLLGPGGSGKTLGVAGWVRDRELGGSTTWITGDPTCDPARLVELLDRPAARPRLVVVDDAQRLPLVTVREIDDRLDRDPASLRLLLLSRWDLPLSRLGPELLGDLTTLRGDLLRLDESESAALVAAHANTSDLGVAEAIAERSRGWCAAVVLAARAVAATPDPVAAARGYAGGHALADRVASEVFATLRPRERHLLLCVASEPPVTAALAVHLTGDSGAGAVLEELARTGLLVTRVSPAAGEEERYTIHPLLAEIVRRRITTGGVDVVRATTAVTRAVSSDAARGEHRDALRRLVALGDVAGAVDLLADSGPVLLLDGGGGLPRELTVDSRAGLEDDPRTWFALALDRWLVADLPRATPWLDKLVALGDTADPVRAQQVACARLMRARVGLDPLAPAVEAAERTLEDAGSDGDPTTPVLLDQLAGAHAWLGDLDRAAELHQRGARAAHVLRMPRLETAMLSGLALVDHARGRPVADPPVLPSGEGHPALVGGLATAVAGPDGTGSGTVPPVPTPHDADPFTAFWVRLLRARSALAGGSLLTALRILDEPARIPLPRHLQVVHAVERALLGTLAGSPPTVLASVELLDALDAPADAALARALGLDLAGDPRRAVAVLEAADFGDACRQPDSGAHAAVLLAQLRDAVGDRRAALDAIDAALPITEVRRDAVPFLDWSWHGSRVTTLLEAHLAIRPSEWAEELLGIVSGGPALVHAFGPRGRADGDPDPGAPVPVLSPRERDVLFELAHGSTYADIAVALFVSENTVKTHVSSLYSKLGASRRSEALAAARSMRLL